MNLLKKPESHHFKVVNDDNGESHCWKQLWITFHDISFIVEDKTQEGINQNSDSIIRIHTKSEAAKVQTPNSHSCLVLYAVFSVDTRNQC